MGPVANLDTEVLLDGSLTAEEQYRALTSGVAVLDRSDAGRLALTGDDALDLINRLSTNELATLEVGAGAATVLTTNKGRIVDLLHVHRSEDRLVVFTSPENQQRVAEWIDFYTFVEDVEIEDETGDTAMLSLTGLGSPKFLDDLTDGQASSLATYERLSAQVSDVAAEVYRSDFLGPPSFDIVIDAEHRNSLFDVLTDNGATPASADAIEALRVQRGIPAFGKELTEDYNPHEANLVHHVSFSKGCYIGQEVIARLQTYKKVSKYLVGLRWDGDGPAAGSFLSHDGKRVGIVTSVARLSHTGANVGLSYVR
ncbi:MAG: folate-binding protein YgfZ, partial [Dehalococcoidia bacterium]|nr:folate-binding protein YgfZ [Dehalococcoidia bacterium]